ncbi:hypothetical protein [Glaciecola sp. SC05]|uniref:hypothetical protein n=1 Tax=Glaciecola sp. SC05 TaxID=1987355 RepID=UPI003528D85F
MSDAVHVFVATTAGLVAIRGIQHRNGGSLASFVTIAGGSRVAGMTPQYRQFVNRDTSPLPGYFEHDSYHMVIDRDIDQGESWQLACAIAHLLYANSKLGSGQVEAGDTVIIATGEVETGSANVRLISHLAQKCMSAQKHILRWQAKHCQLSFIVPEENYKQPLPDIPFALSPVSSISEVEERLVQQGLIGQNVIIDAVVQNNNTAMMQGALMLKGALQQFGQRIPNISRLPKPALRAAPFYHWVKNRNVMGGAIGLIALFIVMWFAFSLVNSWLQSPAIVYDYEVKTFDSCNARETQQRLLPDASVSKLEPLALTEVCSMQVSFEYFEVPPQTLWLVSDSYARMTLPLKDDSQEDYRTWPIPIPSWQEESREYILMVFENTPDASDEDSLDAFLLQLYSKQDPDNPQPLNLGSLQEWASKQSLSVRFISQKLEK